jgi:hypothetical protein
MLRVTNTATTTAASPAKANSHVFLVIALRPAGVDRRTVFPVIPLHSFFALRHARPTTFPYKTALKLGQV